ncbi:MAG: PIG-L family deacetylase [Thermaerobacter sp.]|nr:PIG-L family deacetylase [Thermaerobacter sp.]
MLHIRRLHVWHLTRRLWRWTVVLGALALLAVSFVIYNFNLFYPPQRVEAALPPLPAAPRAGERILVFAPHPDDATLGAGGYIHQAVQAGAQVWLVQVTSGDAFKASVELWYKTPDPTPQQFIDYGYTREQETLRSMRLLGVPADHVFFLGFPDLGTAQLWLHYWNPDHPYRSLYTRVTAAPYRNAWRPGASYTAPSELSELRAILEQVRPDLLITLHPNDVHPDHWATGVFSRTALQELRDAGELWARRVQVYTYLIHRGEWPLPKGYHPSLPLVPPRQLLHTGTRWYRYPLTAATVRLKLQAIEEFRTQTMMMKDFLLSFDRSSELFGYYPAGDVPRIPAGSRPGSGPGRWPGIAPVILDPVGDTVRRDLDGAGDFRALYLALNDAELYVRVQVRTPVDSQVRYQVNFYRFLAVPGGDRLQPLRVTAALGQPLRVWTPTHSRILAERPVIAGRYLQFSLPAAWFQGDRSFMFSATSHQGKAFVDQTAYRRLRLERRSGEG